MKRLYSCIVLICATAAHAADSHTSAARIVVEGTIADLQRRLVARELSCEDVVRAYLARISTYDQATGLNAITAVSQDAIEQAVAVDRRLRQGASLPPLFCVTVAVKDNINTKDLPTTGGSIVLRDNRPAADAPVVRTLRDAGAIVLAKTNMAEWAFSPRRTISSTAGETANAYAPDRVPAGSSGGTASAIAASFATVGLGSDTGNSIRGPSSHLALVGMRPTYGRVSLEGVIPLLLDRDAVGPMTRTVEDNARVLTVVAKSASSEVPVAADYVAQLASVPLRGARIGVLRALAQPDSIDPQIAKLFASAIADLRVAGAIVTDDVIIEDFRAHVEEGYYCPRFRADVNEYLRSLGRSAPVQDILEVFKQGRFAPASREQFAYFLNLNSAGEPVDVDCPQFAHQAERQAFRRAVVDAMDRAQLVALIYPTWTYPPALRVRAVEDYRGDNSQRVAPATGLPAITVPMGFTAEGLPAGLQILGRAWTESQLYALALGYERATQHRRAPARYPAL